MKGIGKRVAVGFMSIVALLFVSGMISLFELGNLSNDTENILSASKRNMELAKEMLDAACDHNVATMNITVLCDDSYGDMCRKALNDLEGRLAATGGESYNKESIDSLASAVSELRMLTDNYILQSSSPRKYKLPEEYSDMPELGPEWGTDVVMADDFELGTVSLSVVGKVWYTEVYKAANDRLMQQIERFVDLNHGTLAPRAAQLNKNAYRSVAPVFISLIVMIAIVLMFFYFINVYCVRPILKINRSLREYLSFKLPYNVKAELIDELKELDDNIETLINISKQNKQ